MKNTEQQLRNLKEQVSLSKSEKAASKDRVFSFVREHPSAAPPILHRSWFAVHPFARYALATLLIFILGGSSISLAANGARPGTLLYPVKVEFNEEIIEALQEDSGDEALYHMERIDRRFEEAESLFKTGPAAEEAFEQVVTYINDHNEEITAIIENISSEGDIEEAQALITILENILDAHASELEELNQYYLDTVQEGEIESIATSTPPEEPEESMQPPDQVHE